MIDLNYSKHSDYPTPEYDNWKEFYPDVKDHIPNEAEVSEPRS